jgi:hypothetical protein
MIPIYRAVKKHLSVVHIKDFIPPGRIVTMWKPYIYIPGFHIFGRKICDPFNTPGSYPGHLTQKLG